MIGDLVVFSKQSISSLQISAWYVSILVYILKGDTRRSGTVARVIAFVPTPRGLGR